MYKAKTNRTTKVNKSTIIISDFNTPCSVINGTSRHKINNDKI